MLFFYNKNVQKINPAHIRKKLTKYYFIFLHLGAADAQCRYASV